MNPGNTNLVRHGIAEDESDYRLHVGIASGKVYIFPTEAGVAVLDNGKQYHQFSVSQPDVKVVTGKGYKVPWQDIDGCQELDIPADLMEILRKINKTTSPSKKGRAAVWTAKEMLKRGLVPVALSTREITEHDMQVRGKDLIITSRLSIQVKCDWWATRYGLALQTHECNPLGRY